MLRALARLPRWVHFAAGGTLLFLGRQLLPAAEEARPAIRIPAARVAAMQEDFQRSLGRPPSAEELRGLVDQEIADLALEQEARRLRLDYGDRAIEQRLVAKMRAIAKDPGLSEAELLQQALQLGLDDDLVVRRQLREKMRLFLDREPRPAPTEAELAQALERHAERFRRPAGYDFTQIFVGAELHPDAQAAAAALRARIVREGLPPEAAALLGDPFPLAARWTGRSREQTARSFGAAFADAAGRAKVGEWSEPVASIFGWHLILLEEKSEGGLPAVDEVRSQLLPLFEEERSAARLEQQIAELRRLYRVEIDWPSQGSGLETGPRPSPG